MKYIVPYIVFTMISIVAIAIYTNYLQPFLFHKDTSVLSASVQSMQAYTSSHSVVPVISNQWYSSIYNGLPTSPIYALPLVVRFTNAGIGISYPAIVKTTDEISSPFDEDMKLVPEGQLQMIKLIGAGDWNVRVQTTSDKNET